MSVSKRLQADLSYTHHHAQSCVSVFGRKQGYTSVSTCLCVIKTLSCRISDRLMISTSSSSSVSSLLRSFTTPSPIKEKQEKGFKIVILRLPLKQIKLVNLKPPPSLPICSVVRLSVVLSCRMTNEIHQVSKSSLT